MSRYFFHVHDGKDCPDHDGVELASLGEVRAQAVIACGEALKDLDGAFWESREWRMQVVDERGATVCVLTLSGACYYYCVTSGNGAEAWGSGLRSTDIARGFGPGPR